MPTKFETYFQDKYLDSITDAEQKSQTVKVFKEIAPIFDEYVGDNLKDLVSSELERRGLAESRRAPLRDHDLRFQRMLDCWKNNGYSPLNPHKKVSWKQLVANDRKRNRQFQDGQIQESDFAFQDGAFYWDNPFLIPRVISTLVREPMEHVQVLGNLLTKVRFDNPSQSLLIPAISAYAAGSLDLAEGDPYPEGQFEYAGTVTATIGKSGISVRFTEEMIRYSLFDVMGMHLRAAGIALARWKEQKISDHILAQGSEHFDNLEAGTPAKWTGGRNSAGLLNGTFVLQDLHDMYASMVNDGFVPNTLLMNPMAWTIFVQDPTMRNWAYAQGPKQIWNTYKGDVATVSEWSAGGQTNGLQHETFVSDPEQVMTTQTDVPSMFPYPLSIIVSPYIPFDGTTSLTDIVLCDRNELGILSVNEEPVTDQWDDPERDIVKVKIRERYAINIMNDGKAAKIARNIKVARAYDYDDKLEWQAGTGALPTGAEADLLALQS